jgi:hypothetical protein
MSRPFWSRWPAVKFILHVGRPLWREDGSVICSARKQVQLHFTLWPTVSRPVRLGVSPLLEQVTSCYIYFSCRASSLKRGRVCNLQCNGASSISRYITTDCQSASSSWCLSRLGASDQMLHLSDNYFLYFSCRAPSLTRGRVCNFAVQWRKFSFKLHCDRRSVGQFVLVPGLQWGP